MWNKHEILKNKFFYIAMWLKELVLAFGYDNRLVDAGTPANPTYKGLFIWRLSPTRLIENLVNSNYQGY